MNFFKGAKTRFELNFSNFTFPFSLFIMLDIVVYNVLSKFRSQMSILGKIQSS